MDEQVQAVEQGEVETPSTPAVEEQTPVNAAPEGSEAVETPEAPKAEGQAVPYDRFREVNEEKNYWREQAIAHQRSQAPVRTQNQQEDELQIPTHLIDADGNVDPIGYAKWVNEQADQRVERKLNERSQREKAERMDWQEAEKAYPELKSDTELRDIVESIRNNGILTGNFVTMKQAADRALGRLKTAEQSGIKKAQVSETIQKVAQPEVGSAKVQPKSDVDEAYKRGIASGDFTEYFKLAETKHLT